MRFVQVTAALIAGALACAGGFAQAAGPAAHTLTVKIGGNGSGAIHGDGIDCWAGDGAPVGPCTITELAGNVVRLTATADAGSVFAGWSGDGCSGVGACTVTLSADVTVTATFRLPTVMAGARVLAVSRSRRTASLPMACKGPGPCTGSVRLSARQHGTAVALAQSRYSIAPGRTRRVPFTFRRSTIALVAAQRRGLAATLTIIPTDGPIRSSRVTLKLA